MSYTTRSGRRTKKVNYSDNQRPSSRSTTPRLPLPTLESDKENARDSENQSEIEILNNDNTVQEPPKKKQKLSTDTDTSPSKPQRRRRRRKKKESAPSEMDDNVVEEVDFTSLADVNNTNTNTSTVPAIPPPLLPVPACIVVPPLPTFTSPAKPKKRRAKRKRKTTKQEASDDASSSDDDIEILPRKKRKLPPPKPKKKTAKSPKKKKAKPEKRRARKRICSQKTRERIARAKSQRLFMINATVIDEYEREYAVLGSTGNVYTITIGTLHNCTCPDFAKGNLCKHVLFVVLKVLRVASHSEYLYQKALLTTELDEVFSAAPQTLFGSVLANASVRTKYKKSMGQDVDEDEEDAAGQMARKPLDGADCPVCMEEFKGSEATTYCRARCGNNVHVQCFNEWRANAERDGNDVECMFCRAKWVFGKEDSKGKRKKKGSSGYNEGYMNLADEQGMSRRRDTSSYHRNGWNGYGSYRKRYGRRRWY
eukprot:70152_1